MESPRFRFLMEKNKNTPFKTTDAKFLSHKFSTNKLDAENPQKKIAKISTLKCKPVVTHENFST